MTGYQRFCLAPTRNGERARRPNRTLCVAVGRRCRTFHHGTQRVVGDSVHLAVTAVVLMTRDDRAHLPARLQHLSHGLRVLHEVVLLGCRVKPLVDEHHGMLPRRGKLAFQPGKLLRRDVGVRPWIALGVVLHLARETPVEDDERDAAVGERIPALVHDLAAVRRPREEFRRRDAVAVVVADHMVARTIEPGERLFNLFKPFDGFVVAVGVVLEVSQLDGEIRLAHVEQVHGLVKLAHRIAVVPMSQRLQRGVVQVRHHAEAHEWPPLGCLLAVQPNARQQHRATCGANEFSSCHVTSSTAHEALPV